VDPGEECDDGNSVQGDGCNNDCVLSGTELWTRTYESGEALGVATDGDDNVIVVGRVHLVDQGTDFWVGKHDASGAELWTRSFDGSPEEEDLSLHDAACGVATDSAGNLFVVGVGGGAWHEFAWLGKLDADGNEQWIQTHGVYGSHSAAHGAATDSNDNLIAGGGLADGQGSDIWVRKQDPAGDELWSDKDGSLAGEHAYGVAVDGADAVVVAGHIRVLGTQGYIHSDIWVRKYDPAGNELWTRTHDAGDTGDAAYGVATDRNGNVVVVGTIAVPDYPDTDAAAVYIWIRKYDPSGSEVWTRIHDSSSEDNARGVATDSADSIVVVGWTNSPGESSDAWIGKYDASGDPLWTRAYDSGVDNDDAAHGVATDSADNVIVVGRYDCPAGEGHCIWVRKYTP
jgi:hypothetical protein